MSFGILPTEVVELILISAATDGFPHAIAAFAQTSKFNRALVYESKDQHLWREVFLATFDDPRASGGGPGWAECTPKHSQASTSHTRQDSVYDWEGVFKQRIWAADYIRTRTNSEPHRRSTLHPETTHRNIRALDTLASVISTALPCPPTIVFSFLSSGDSPNPASPSHSNPHAKYPTFPPVPQAINGPSNNLHPDTGPATFGQAVRAHNTAWLESVLSKGLPPEITASFSAEQWEGGLTNRFLDQDRFCELQAAARIIACIGFVPTPQAVAELAAPPSPYGTSEEAEASTYMSPAKQLERARRLARMRVYNLRYLTRERHWGPFLERDFTPSARRPLGTAGTVPENDDDLLQPLIELFRLQPPHVVVHHHHHDSDEEDDEEEDPDYTPRDADESTSEEDQTDTDHTMSEDDQSVVDPENEDEEGPVAQTGAPGESSPPTSAQLRADWAYLAAVRVVVEANLRETFGAQDLRGLLSLDGLRAGSAPWDVSAYRAPPAEEQEGHPSLPSGSPDSKGKAKDAGAVEGWDWAGVTGVWMRCICWLDYRDLILHNCSGTRAFDDPQLQEAVRIISMTVRVESYSQCDVPGYTHLPNIHIVGETTTGLNHHLSRRIYGTVSVIADGSVRWMTYSKVEGGDMDEWVSEGIQVGGVASAMGVLGMWTGATHERMDPLGPGWAWKVA